MGFGIVRETLQALCPTRLTGDSQPYLDQCRQKAVEVGAAARRVSWTA